MVGDPLKSYRWVKLRRAFIAQATPICHLCGRHIDKRISGRLPNGPSVDHKIPRSVDPSLTFVWNNLALACMACNGGRGDRLLDGPVTSRDW